MDSAKHVQVEDCWRKAKQFTFWLVSLLSRFIRLISHPADFLPIRLWNCSCFWYKSIVCPFHSPSYNTQWQLTSYSIIAIMTDSHSSFLCLNGSWTTHMVSLAKSLLLDSAVSRAGIIFVDKMLTPCKWSCTNGCHSWICGIARASPCLMQSIPKIQNATANHKFAIQSFCQP